MSSSDFYEFMDLVYQVISAALLPGAGFYICHADTMWHEFRRPLSDHDLILRQCLVWIKNQFVLSKCDYHYRHEPILFGWIPNGKRLKNSDRTKTTVWEFARPKRSELHPTMKPVEMWVYAIGQHTKQKNVLYEPFSGSGTTHIACEKTNRKCYGMELDPAYCDVIIKRWEDYTGKKAVLESNITDGQHRPERSNIEIVET